MENVALDVLFVGEARDFFDDSAEYAVAEVGIGFAGAGVEIEGAAHHVLDDLARLGRRFCAHDFGDLDGAEHRIERSGAVEAGGVMEELADGDLEKTGVHFLAGLEVGWVVEQFEGVVVEMQLAALLELEDGGGGERLGDTGDAEERVGLNGETFFEIGVAVAACVDEFSIAGEGEGCAGDVVVVEESEDEVVEGGEVGEGLAGGWEIGVGGARGERADKYGDAGDENDFREFGGDAGLVFRRFRHYCTLILADRMESHFLHYGATDRSQSSVHAIEFLGVLILLLLAIFFELPYGTELIQKVMHTEQPHLMNDPQALRISCSISMVQSVVAIGLAIRLAFRRKGWRGAYFIVGVFGVPILIFALIVLSGLRS